MHTSTSFDPVDYLIIGHVTQDVVGNGLILGGTVSYASLTAKAFGLRVGIVTACSIDLDLTQLDGIFVHRKASPVTSTFENTPTPAGRVQHIHHVAEKLTINDIPPAWLDTPIVHLGPLADEIGPEMVTAFPDSLVGITPQGWMRGWDGDHLVTYRDWPHASQVLPQADALVMSIEDIRGNEDIVADYASRIPVLVVTEGAKGERVYWNGDVRHFSPPIENEVDAVGAGDIFAASFFIKLKQYQDPWEAARFATLVAANSVTRPGITGVPNRNEIRRFTAEVLENPAR
ncbi:MAG TPA: PfkB family carbohydrate kinase [Anaerolineaceae bacterium]|nr:PfkB family carbohydrate kinase [Anaerolineaceae bacterium]